MSLSDADRQYLIDAILLAMRGRGQVEPNPMVGCVIAKDNKIVGQGFHERFGGPHAEPNALADAGDKARGATVYVTLEPCCHTHKKTPPCVPALIAAGVKRVVIGCQDPNPQVSGKGMKELLTAGIEVEDAADPRCRQLIAPFIARVVHHRPYVTLKWAQSVDGKVAGAWGKPIRISNRRSTSLVHTLRAHSDGIMIGIGTARMDDPLLTARKVAKARPLLRAVLDSDLRLSPDSRLAQTTDLGPVLVFCSKEAAEYSGTRVALAAMGVQICPLPSDAPGRLSLSAALSELGRRGLTHLIVEPGPTLTAAFLEQDLADRVWVIQSSKRIEDDSAPAAPKVDYPVAMRVELDDDLLLEYLNPKSDVFFQADRSADLLDI